MIHLRIPLQLFSIILFFFFADNVFGNTLEIIQQQFEIYQRHSGEIEILSTDNVAEIDHVLKRIEVKRLAVRKALDNTPASKQTEPKLPLTFFTENDAAPFMHYVTVERAFAHRALQQNKLDDAVHAIEYVFRLTEVLSASGSLELRRGAALIRLQIMETVQSCLMNPHCRRKHHELFYTLLDKQLNNRESDKTTWIRYRDEGKLFFEKAAQGSMEKMISPKQWNELLNSGAIEPYKKSPLERWTHDQTVFMQVSSAMIESSEVPYYRRKAVLQQLDKELLDRQGTANEPIFALLLLRNVSELMRLFAQEQSSMEMAYLALSASLHGESRRQMMNFLTGNAYEFYLIPGGIMCTYEGNVKQFYVPHR